MTQRYMIVEHFRDRTGDAVYKRYREKGRMMPAGLEYIDSWVRMDRGLCYQLMECADPNLLNEWMANWEDLMEFEVVPVIDTQQAKAMDA